MANMSVMVSGLLSAIGAGQFSQIQFYEKMAG